MAKKKIVKPFDIYCDVYGTNLSDRYATDGKRGSKSEEIGRIVHEITHHVLRVCVAKGIPTFPEMDNLVMDEPLAYLVEFYTRNVLKKLWKELR